jgi:hypothetical protein
VNKARASYFGEQKTPVPFVASSDYAKMVLNAYNSQLDWNKSYEVIGKSPLSFQDALTQYVELHHLDIKGVSSTPYFIGNMIATLSCNKQLKDTVAFMKYFERATTGNFDLPKLQGETTFNQWLEKNNYD